jgi:polar amino acid transport system substrate-binding protein
MRENVMKIATLAIVSCLLMAAAQPTPAEETIRLTNGEWQPYFSEHSPHYGFASHIISEAFALVGVRVEYGFFPWKRALESAKKGQWDGGAAFWDSEERRKHFYFSEEPVVPTEMAFFHLKSTEFDWNGVEDLKDLKIGATLEYFYGEELDEAEKASLLHIERVGSDELSLKKLLKGRIDVFPGDLMVTYAQIQDTFSAEEAALFTHHPKTFESRGLYLLFSKQVEGNEQMRDLFDKGLRQLKESGRYEEIIADALAGKYAKSN